MINKVILLVTLSLTLCILGCDRSGETASSARLDSINETYNRRIAKLQDSLSFLRMDYRRIEDSLLLLDTRLAEKASEAAPFSRAKIDSLSHAYRQTQKQADQLKDSISSLYTNYKVLRDSILLLEQSLDATSPTVSNQESPTAQEVTDSSRAIQEARLLKLKDENQELNERIAALANELEEENRRITFLKDSLSMVTNTQTKPVLPPGSNALSEAFRILLFAKRTLETDPTLGLQLMAEALKLSQDSILLAETAKIYQENLFYQNVHAFAQPVMSFDQGGEEWVVLLEGGLASYFDLSQSPEKVNEFKNISAIELAAQKDVILLGNPQGQIGIYNTELNNLQKTLKAHQQPVTVLAFPADLNTYIISGSEDKSLQIFTKGYKKTTRLVGLRSGVTSLAVNSKYELIAAASGDTEPRVWNFDGKLILKLPTHPDSVHHICISDKGDRLLTLSGSQARLWNIDGNLITLIKHHETKLSAVAFANTTSRSATGDLAGNVVLRDEYGKYLATLKGHANRITKLKFSEDDRLLYSSSADGTIKKWLLTKPNNVDFSVVDPLGEGDRKRFGIR